MNLTAVPLVTWLMMNSERTSIQKRQRIRKAMNETTPTTANMYQ